MNAKRDENSVPTLLGVLNTDGNTPIAIRVHASSHGLVAADGTSGSDLGPTNAKRDENNVATLMGVSSTDGVTPVAVYADNQGRLLIKST